MKLMRCIYCKTTHVKRFLDCPPYYYEQCLQCNLIFRNNPKEKKEVNKNLYGNREFIGDYFARDYYWKKVYKLILSKIKKVKPKGTFLDIGSSYGLFLSMARKKKYEISGIEIEKEAADFSRSRYKLNVKNTSLLDFKTNKTFDVVTLIDVLEHLENLEDVQKKINTLIKKDGILFIKVPNIESLVFKFTRRGWNWLLPEVHLYQFNKAFLKKYLTEGGFEVLNMWSYDDKSEFAYNITDVMNLKKRNILEKVIGKGIRIILLSLFSFSFIWEKMGKGGGLYIMAKKT